MKKILTVSIAAYNVEKFIEGALKSLVCSQMDKLEVIIQNDGSTDLTSDLALNFVKKYPTTFILNNKNNGGYGSTINASLNMATGKYFKQLDGDDWYNTNYLDAFIKVLETVESDCVYSPYIEYYEYSNKYITKKLDKFKEGCYSIDDVINEPTFMQMHSLCFKTELLKKNKVTILENCFYTDQEFILYPLIHVKNVYVTTNPIYMYRLGLEGQSVSKTGYINHIDDHKKVVTKLLEFISSNKIDSPIVHARINTQILGLINTQYLIFLWAKNKKNEVKNFDQYLRNNYKDVYQVFLLKANKSVKFLIYTRFLFYKIISFYVLKK